MATCLPLRGRPLGLRTVPGSQLRCLSRPASFHRWHWQTGRRGCAVRAGKDGITPKFLTFEADPKAGGVGDSEEASDVVERASAALERARAYLAEAKQRAPSRPMPGESSADRSEHSASEPAMRTTLEDALSRLSSKDLDWAQDLSSQRPSDSYDQRKDQDPGWFDHGSMDEADLPTSPSKPAKPASKPAKPAASSQPGSKPQGTQPTNGASTGSSKDGREQSWMQYIPEAKPQPQGLAKPKLAFAEPQLASLDLTSQEMALLEASRSRELPPLQSVMELTGAVRMPQRGELPVTSQPTTAGRSMEDGQGVLPDGTRYERQSGEEFGENGHWYRWSRLRGVSQGGKVEWEERWWEASDWGGMREMGAEKSGCGVDGSAWRETWREAIAYDEATGEPLVERSAHKWAHTAKGDEWEERWGEHYRRRGQASKYADKWAQEGGQVWHERWGEDYDGEEGCVKWTDKWAERLTAQGGREKWGDKWEERFKHGAGAKTGETWNETAARDKYQRWWGENHHGNGWVQKHGHSSTGEEWDVSEQMDTYYNPIPHFGYDLALAHSPTLRRVPTRPRGSDDLDDGLDAL